MQRVALFSMIFVLLLLAARHARAGLASSGRRTYHWERSSSTSANLQQCLSHEREVTTQLRREIAQSIDPGASKGRITCAVPCFADHKSKNRWRVYDGRSHSLTLQFTQEGPAHYPRLHNSVAQDADGLATAVPDEADVPVPYFSLEVHRIQRENVSLGSVIKGATFVARNCNSKNDRETAVKALQSHIRVDSISHCLHNAHWPVDDKRDKDSALRKYAMTLAFENQNSWSHVTEKVWQALAAGVLPVYFGAPDIAHYVPEGSVVIANEFHSWNMLGQYLKQVLGNETLFSEYHKWRYQPLSGAFLDMHAYTLTSDDCRACKLLYSRVHKLTWNHRLQDIEWPCCSCSQPNITSATT